MRFFLVLSALLLGFEAPGAIFELSSYRELDISKVTPNTLVVFDIDNTLLRQDRMIGTHQWGDYIKKRAVANGMTSEQASQLQHKSFSELQTYLPTVPVEDGVRSILKELQQKSIAHFAFTARAPEIKQVTLKQLGVLEHDFAINFPQVGQPSLLEEHLYQGVIFSGSIPKGELLKKIVTNMKTPPQEIIFIDDRSYNLESVEGALVGSDIKLSSYRYGGADSVVASFDPALADLEYSFFKEYGLLLGDALAGELVVDVHKILDLRFQEFKKIQGIAGASLSGCNPLGPEFNQVLRYKCEYSVENTPSAVDFELKRSPLGHMFFGNW